MDANIDETKVVVVKKKKDPNTKLWGTPVKTITP